MTIGASLGRANVVIRATLDQLDGDLMQARGQVNSAVSRMVSEAGKNFQALGTAAMTGIKAATVAVVGLGVALAKVTIDAAPVEGISQAFDGLAESAGHGADEMLAALQRGSAGMISQRDLMMSFNQAAQLVSTDFAVQLPDAMQYLGKVSAATGQDMGFMLDSLVKGVGRLSPMILDNLGIQVALSEATERASEMFGVEADALDKAQVQAGMMSVVLEKLEQNTAAMPDVTESASAKLAQMKARFQDVKDQIGVAFLPVLTTMLGTFGDLADRFLPPVLEGIEELAPVVAEVAERVGEFVAALLGGQDPLTAFKELIAGLFPAEIAERITGIVDGIVQFGEKVAEFLAPIIEWVGANVELQDVLIVLGAAIASVVLPALWGIITAVAPIIAVFAVAVAAVAALRSAWESDFLGIRTFIQETLAQIQAWWAEHGDAVLTRAREAYETVRSAIDTAIQFVRGVVGDALAAIQAFWQAHGDTITTVAQNAWNAIHTIIDTIIHNISAIIEAVSLAIRGDWKGFGEKLREIWDATWETIKTILSTAWDSIKTIVSDMINSIVAFFRDTDWGAVGRGIISGITAGVRAAASRLADAAIAAARAALDAVKGFLGIDSPSRKAARQIGVPFVEGIGQGLAEAQRRLMAAASGLSVELLQTTEIEMVSRGDIGTQQGQVIIYGLTLEGVQDAQGLLGELQALAL